MGNVPERIWATEDTANFGEDRFHSTTPMRGLTEYLRADIAAAREADLRAKIKQLGREVNISRYGQPDFAWSIHTAAMDDLRAEVERLRGLLDEALPVIEEAAAVAHKAFVAANMEAVNAGPTHPLKNQLDAWRVRCMNAEQRASATLAKIGAPA